MTLLMIIRVAFRALVRNKMRAALTMLGIIIGVSAVIAMVSIGQGASASVQAQIESIGTNLLFVSAGAQNVGGVRSGTGDTGTNTLTVDDLECFDGYAIGQHARSIDRRQHELEHFASGRERAVSRDPKVGRGKRRILHGCGCSHSRKSHRDRPDTG
jgi:hypothetical protein